MNKKKTIEETYQKKTQLEHILLRPDAYVGSIETQRQSLWVFDEASQKMDFREISWVPGLYKIFDEILVNAADNFQRDPAMNCIRIEIRPSENKIAVWNNGKGIPIEIHKGQGCYVPEMIFGQLLTSSNYDDDQKKTTGGRNGYGAKLANIFSTEFILETGDAKRNKHYTQVFRKNMTETDPPTIEANRTGQDFTCVTFHPDLKKFKMSRLDADMVSLLTKRAYDLAGVSDPKVRVFLNDKRIEIKSFAEYCDLYLTNEENKELPKVIEVKTERWQIVASLSEGQFQQVSFVNSIATIKGGTHVNAVVDQITTKIQAALQKKNKKLVIKPHMVKAQLWIFVNALIVNPAFDSQTKDTLTTRSADFGSTVQLSEKFLKGVLDSGLVDHVLKVASAKEDAKMARVLKPGGKKSKLLGIPKLEDANDAGTRAAGGCTIILTEGDSAKSLALAGIELVGRDKYGVFPLRGKFLNVREASNKQLMENPEIQNLIKILGVAVGSTYEDTSRLRYGSIMIMTDQDHDGSHIKGLLINFIHHFWPSLFRMEGFLREFVTPIIKATKKAGGAEEVFFTIPEYEAWAAGRNLSGYKVKYYKGLGTSTAKEAKEYFSKIAEHTIDFEYVDEADDGALDLAFSKKQADARKTWLEGYQPNVVVDHSVKHLRYLDFVNKELIQFSVADCARSIPHLCDGLKPGQRKILFSSFKRKLKNEIKVAQLCGYVAEHSAYHHGEVSLQSTIVAMAQNFVGANNINLLLPIGQFGTRNQGGKEAASARYIFTALSPVTRHLFPESDDAVLDQLEDEGQRIEPQYYLPIIPLCLVNGAEGIGTGWSTSIPQYDPRGIIENIKRLMQGEELVDMHPWYKGYTGTIVQDGTRHVVTGVFNVLGDDELEITELPIGKWTRDYKNFLEELAQKEEIDDIREYHQENRVHFVLRVPGLEAIERKEGGIVKKFKLSTTLAGTNLVLFDASAHLRRYASPADILKDWFGLRSQLYERRKEYLLAKLLKEYETLRNKARFIQAVIVEDVHIKRVKKRAIAKQLKEQNYATQSELDAILKESSPEVVNNDEEEANDDENDLNQEQEDQIPAGETNPNEYNYLLSMPLWSLTEEKIEELTISMNKKKDEHAALAGRHVHELWKEDLENLEDALVKQEALDERDRQAHKGMSVGGKKKGGRAKKAKAAPENNKKAIVAPTTKSAPKIKKAAEPKTNGVNGKSAKPKSPKSAQSSASGKVGSPVQQIESLSLRERLALKAGVDHAKLPPKMGNGPGPGQAKLDFNKIGQKRILQKHDDDMYMDDEEFSGAMQRPRDAARQREPASFFPGAQNSKPTARSRSRKQNFVVDESDEEDDVEEEESEF